MTVYVDDMQRQARVGRLNAKWSHLTADTDDELHEFAARLGLKRAWHQKPGTPISHYDVTEPKRQLAIRLGAVPIGYMSEESKNLIRRKIAEREASKRQSEPNEAPLSQAEVQATYLRAIALADLTGQLAHPQPLPGDRARHK